MNNQAYIEQKVKYLNVNYEYIEKKKNPYVQLFQYSQCTFKNVINVQS